MGSDVGSDSGVGSGFASGMGSGSGPGAGVGTGAGVGSGVGAGTSAGVGTGVGKTVKLLSNLTRDGGNGPSGFLLIIESLLDRFANPATVPHPSLPNLRACVKIPLPSNCATKVAPSSAVSFKFWPKVASPSNSPAIIIFPVASSRNNHQHPLSSKDLSIAYSLMNLL